MKQFGFFLLLISLFSGIVNRSSAQSAFSSIGNVVSDTDGSISYTVGQVFQSTIPDGKSSIREGVQQPFEVLVVGSDSSLDHINLTSAFPNPASKELHLTIAENIEGYSYCLYTMSGQLLLKNDLISQKTIIPVEDIVSGVYFLTVKNQEGKIKKFKIVKTN